MTDSFFAYIERLELQFFFSGYLVIYSLAYLFFKRLLKYLPFAYAISGLIYLGWLLKSVYPDYSIEHVIASVYNPPLKLIGLAALLSWIPVIRKPVFTIAHSIFFFILL